MEGEVKTLESQGEDELGEGLKRRKAVRATKAKMKP